MNSKRLIALLALIILSQCQKLTTDDVLATNFSGINKSPPEPLYPIQGNTTTALKTEFAWSARAGFATYRVDISTASDFSQPISGSPFIAQGASLTVTLPDAVTYWWRVSTSLMQGQPIAATFEAIDDSLYVYCKESTTCDDTNQVGNKVKPFQTLRTAISTAKPLGKSVKVASRGSSAQAYAESITLADGVSMYGGYTPAFTETLRNGATNVTAITSSAIPVIGTSIAKTTIFDGFKVIGLLGYGIYLDACSANLTIRNSNIASGDVTSGNTAAITINGGSPNIIGNTATGGNATATTGGGATYAILNQSGSSATISGNTLTSGNTAGSGGSTCIRNISSAPQILNNIIAAGNPTGTGDTVGITATVGSNARIINNTIVAGTAPTGRSSIGIWVGNSSPTIASNPTIVNNVILTTAGPTRYCIAEFAGNAGFANPAAVQNNLLFNCPTALYYNVDGPNANTAIIDANNSTLTSSTGTVSGNVTIAGAQNPFVNLAAKNYRLQNNSAPMTAQEWLDIAYGGLNTGTSTYGSITTDLDSKIRTATTGGATNTNASGYSIGAFEF